MRAILVSGNSQLSRGPEGARGVFAPLVDRPFLQHVVESIVGKGIQEIDFVLAPDDRAAETLLGDGTRWGATFSFHLAEESNVDCVKRIAECNPDEHVLLAMADRLPLIDGDVKAYPPTLFCWRDRKVLWSGWGVIETADLRAMPQGLDETEIFGALLEMGANLQCAEGKKPLSARSYLDLVDANRRVLNREFPGLLMGGKEIEPGIWVSRNVKVHPTAKLHSPAFLGENSRVGAMVEVGPGTSIGRNCMIERDTQVTDSVVFSGTYVGQHLALRSVIVDRSRLVNTKWDVEIEGVDELLLGSVFGTPFATQIQRFCGRVAAFLALALTLPILLLLYVGSLLGWVPGLRREQIVLTPTVRDSFRWKTFSLWSFGERQTPLTRADWMRDFFFCFLPALVPIVAGRMNFVGSKARNREEAVMATMIHDVLFLYSYTGFLQPSLFDGGTLLCDEQTGAIGSRGTLLLVLQYAGAVIGMFSPTTPSSSSQDRYRAAAAGGSRYEN